MAYSGGSGLKVEDNMPYTPIRKEKVDGKDK
jgi:hypothetical protein